MTALEDPKELEGEAHPGTRDEDFTGGLCSLMGLSTNH